MIDNDTIAAISSEAKSSSLTDDLVPSPKKKNVSPYIIFLAMGIHASFTGLALGVFDNLAGFFGFFVAIVLHKWAEALTIGISFAKSEIHPKAAFTLAIISSLATPFGVLIGYLFDSSSGYVKGTLLGISAGTFIYISTTEIIVEEFSVGKRKVLKYVFLQFGILLMVGMWFIEQFTGD